MPYDPSKPLYLQTANASKIQYDQRGVPFSLDKNGQRLYILDYKISPKPKTNFFSEMKWDTKTGTWKRSTDKNKVLSAGILGVIGGGVGAAALGGGGGAAAAAPSVAGPAGGTAAATTGGTVAGNMGWLGPVLNYGVPAVSQFISNRQQNSADAEAARIYTEHLDRALAEERENKEYQRGQYANYLARLKPYGDAGTAAVSRASNLLTTSRYRPEQGQGGGGTVGMVALKDGTGRVRHVPEQEAERWLAQGAMRA